MAEAQPSDENDESNEEEDEFPFLTGAGLSLNCDQIQSASVSSDFSSGISSLPRIADVTVITKGIMNDLRKFVQTLQLTSNQFYTLSKQILPRGYEEKDGERIQLSNQNDIDAEKAAFSQQEQESKSGAHRRFLVRTV